MIGAKNRSIAAIAFSIVRPFVKRSTSEPGNVAVSSMGGMIRLRASLNNAVWGRMVWNQVRQRLTVRLGGGSFRALAIMPGRIQARSTTMPR